MVKATMWTRMVTIMWTMMITMITVQRVRDSRVHGKRGKLWPRRMGQSERTVVEKWKNGMDSYDGNVDENGNDNGDEDGNYDNVD